MLEWDSDNDFLRLAGIAVAAIYDRPWGGSDEVELRVRPPSATHVEYFHFPPGTDRAWLRRLAERMAMLTKGA